MNASTSSPNLVHTAYHLLKQDTYCNKVDLFLRANIVANASDVWHKGMKFVLDSTGKTLYQRTGSSYIGFAPLMGGVHPPSWQACPATKSFTTFFCEEQTLAVEVSSARVCSSQRSSRAEGRRA